jgi:hypothetical protein
MFFSRTTMLLCLSLAFPVACFAQTLSASPPNPIARPQFMQPSATQSLGQSTAPTDEQTGCAQALSAAGAVFQRNGRHEGAGQCGIDDAVTLNAIGAVRLQPEALLTCQTALAFSQFMTSTITPQARQHLQSAPQTVFIAASYACRGRNNVAGARLSEHSYGRAVDVRALTLENGESWRVEPQPSGSTTPDARFQAALRAAACGPFTTVLGPGSDGHHTDHIHFDNAPRSSTYCR